MIKDDTHKLYFRKLPVLAKDQIKLFRKFLSCQHPVQKTSSQRHGQPAPMDIWERGISEWYLHFLKKGWNVVLYEEVQTKVWLQSKTYVFNNNIERVAPFNRLYGATRWLHLINYLEQIEPPCLWGGSKYLIPYQI